MSEPTEEKPFTVEAARAVVLASGELEALEGPHFRSGRDGGWDSVFLADETHPHPDFARVIITRRGQAPREVAISWADYAEVIEGDDPSRTAAEREWITTRGRKPMAIFGSEAERHGYRVTFADVLAPLLGRGTRLAPESGAPAGRDFAAEIAAADSLATLDEIERDGRAARIFTPDPIGTGLHRALRAKRVELAAAEASDAWATPAVRVETTLTPAPAPSRSARRAPQDHFPPAGNRAARRKKSRGGRR